MRSHPARFRYRRRLHRLVPAGAALAVAAALLVATPAGAEPEVPTAEGALAVSATVVDLGVAATQVNVRTGVTAVFPDGTPVAYVLSDGNPVSFNVINVETGALISSFPLPPKSIGGYPAVAPDGSAYFGVRDGRSTLVYHYDPLTNDVEFLIESPTGDSVTRSLVVGENGLVYGTTYPRAKAFTYDPQTGEVVDFGSVTTGDAYGWGLEEVNGTMYIGTGIGEGHVMTVDTATREIAELALPPEYDEALTYFYRFQQVGDLVAMAFSPGLPGGTNTAFWDTVNQEWACEGAIGTFLQLNGPYTQATPDGVMYYKSGGEIWSFDSSDCSTAATGWADLGLSGSHRVLDLVMVGEADAAEPWLVGVNNDGSMWRFNPSTGEHAEFESEVLGAPLTAHTVTSGPDDQIYVSTYLGPGTISRYDPATEQITQLNGPGQADSWLTYGDEVLVGSYPNAIVHRGDPAQPWDWGTNPAHAFQLIGDAQDRVISMATDGALVALGTVSDYGVRGGALTITDMNGTIDVYRDPVPNQSVTSVAFGADGLVYAGTSIRGGLSSPNSPLDAHLVVVDPATGTQEFAGVPVPGNDVVAALAVRGETVWGLTNTGMVFGFDTASRTVTSTTDLGTGRSASPWGLGSTLQANPVDGLLYGIAGESVFVFDPATQEFRILTEPGFKRLTITTSGQLYAVGATNLYRIDLEGTVPACTATIDGQHTGPLTVTDGVTCVLGATVDGPVTVGAGGSLVVRDATLVGPVAGTSAATIAITDSSITGPVMITGSTVETTIAGNEIVGPLACSGNTPEPTNAGVPNTVSGSRSGQCADL
ncbi:hypothetical protein [Occultella gossypii]|uniref:PQQ-like domain-containing protein n=1 Tax=Occultella gossypii TaxID=2800820 RepID=A0ABS7SJS9_9MICO|nr:hypothetical protein [Occultella gossypii]MBZ2199553.1 hypothetical protein [Occultella gossypii]